MGLILEMGLIVERSYTRTYTVYICIWMYKQAYHHGKFFFVKKYFNNVKIWVNHSKGFRSRKKC